MDAKTSTSGGYRIFQEGGGRISYAYIDIVFKKRHFIIEMGLGLYKRKRFDFWFINLLCMVITLLNMSY